MSSICFEWSTYQSLLLVNDTLATSQICRNLRGTQHKYANINYHRAGAIQCDPTLTSFPTRTSPHENLGAVILKLTRSTRPGHVGGAIEGQVMGRKRNGTERRGINTKDGVHTGDRSTRSYLSLGRLFLFVSSFIHGVFATVEKGPRHLECCLSHDLHKHPMILSPATRNSHAGARERKQKFNSKSCSTWIGRLVSLSPFCPLSHTASARTE